jgi:hypothetical protein
MSKTLKTILIVLAIAGLIGAGYGVARLLQDTQPSSVQHSYPLTITVLVSGDFECVLSPAVLTLHKGETATVQITNTVTGGFDAKIQYILAGLPEGSYSFSVNPVDPGQATTLTINGALLQSNATYACQLTAGDTGTLIYED